MSASVLKGKQRQDSPRDEEAGEQDPLLTHPRASSSSHRSNITAAALYRSLACILAVITCFHVSTSWLSAREARHPSSGSGFPKFDPTLGDGHTPAQRNPAYMSRGPNGAVATEVDTCSQEGVEILKEGGNAVDAAIASCLCVGAINSFASGIGGGGFMVYRPSPSSNGHEQPVAIDFRETAPTGSHPDMFKDNKLASIWGGLAIGVPGELRGLEAAFEHYGSGRVSWKRLFQPAIRLSESQTVKKEVARRLRIPLFGDFIKNNALWKNIFMKNGKFLGVGDELKRPAFAETLRTIAEKGADAFYHGPVAEAMVRSISGAGSLVTMEDLAAYKPILTPALQGNYRNRTVWTTQAPTSGPVLLSLLNSLEDFDLPEEGKTPLNVHRFIEAQKLAFAARSELGDPRFTNTSNHWQQITSDKFAQHQHKRIDDATTHALEYYGPKFDIHPDRGTTHLSVVDAEGNAVALTSTINFIYGSQVMCPETGVIFNNEMADFAAPGESDPFGLAPSPFNYPEGPRHPGEMGKRSMSSTSASILEDEQGEFAMAIGGSGGSRIFGAVAQVILNYDWGFDLSHAIEEPRVHHQLLPAQTSVESGIAPEVLAALRLRGHNISVTDINFGLSEVQAVARGKEWYYGASDSRKNGVPAAY